MLKSQKSGWAVMQLVQEQHSSHCCCRHAEHALLPRNDLLLCLNPAVHAELVQELSCAAVVLLGKLPPCRFANVWHHAVHAVQLLGSSPADLNQTLAHQVLLGHGRTAEQQ